MASIHEEDIIAQEESGRRTRSGRKVVNTIPITSRTTRRSTRKQTQEQIIEVTSEVLAAAAAEGGEVEIAEEEEEKSESDLKYAQSDIIKEMLAEAAQGVLVDNDAAEQESIQYTEIQDASEIHDIIENIEGPIDVPDTTETSGTEPEMMAQYSDEQIIEHADDEKSSSFPFGNVQQSENSDGKTDENIVTNISECVDSSLLASLVGDNANSLPSAGEESQSKENFDSITNETKLPNNIELPMEDSKSDPAIAENLPNGESTNDKTILDDAEMVSEDELTSQSKSNKVFDVEIVSEDELPSAVQTECKVTDAEVVSDDELTIPTKSVADAEVVSEDELPAPVKVKVTDAEEVSDDELPGPQRAELPADTEVVSEEDEELPSSSLSSSTGAAAAAVTKKTSNKRKIDEEYNPNSPTSEDADTPEKKIKLQDEEMMEKEEIKKLPELDKYWKAVNDDPADFTGWTYLLQYVDQENDVEAAREAYDAFLAHYPYCYGYWRKYADYEKRKGNRKRCEEVFERGLKAIPLSVDLWIHYLTHVKTNYPDNEEHIRSQFERALSACGLEFRSDKLWEAFIKWELECKRYSQVARIYDRLLATPTQGYNSHFDSYQDLINNQPPSITVSIEEFKKIRSEVREEMKQEKDDKNEEIDKIATDETIPSVLETEDEADDHVRDEEELTAIRDKIITSRRKIHKATVAAVTARWTYEEGIKRPYFHVKPLERCQLKNWKDYLDYEIEKGDRKRILILFERCLIACALYDEFWLKLIRYLESQNTETNDDSELIAYTRDAYERACTIHHSDKPCLHLMWSAFEECQNNFDKAADILRNLEKVCPNLLQIAYRRINLERRRGDYDKCKELYEHYISTAKNKNISGSLAIKYARFLHKICGSLNDGYNILVQTLEKDPANTRVALQMIDLALQRDKVNENEIVQIMDKFMSRENMDLEQKVLFAQRKVEFLEDFGSTSKGLQDAQRSLQIALNKANEGKKRSESSPNKKLTSTITTTSSSSSTSKDQQQQINTSAVSGIGQTTATNYNNNYSGYSSGSTTNSQYYGGNQSYQSYDSYGYNHWQQSGYGYSGYGQWSGYGNYY